MAVVTVTRHGMTGEGLAPERPEGADDLRPLMIILSPQLARNKEAQTPAKRGAEGVSELVTHGTYLQVRVVLV